MERERGEIGYVSTVSAFLFDHTFSSVRNESTRPKTMSAVRNNSDPTESLLYSASEIK